MYASVRARWLGGPIFRGGSCGPCCRAGVSNQFLAQVHAETCLGRLKSRSVGHGGAWPGKDGQVGRSKQPHSQTTRLRTVVLSFNTVAAVGESTCTGCAWMSGCGGHG